MNKGGAKKMLNNLKNEMIDLIKCSDERFASISDDHIIYLYQQWSQETACSGWLITDKSGILKFIKWSFETPFDASLEHYPIIPS